MFNFLKDKLKSAISKFSKDIDEKAETKEEEVEVKKPVKKAKKKEVKKEKKTTKKESKEKVEKPSKKEKKKAEVKEEPVVEISEEAEEKELDKEISEEIEKDVDEEVEKEDTDSDEDDTKEDSDDETEEDIDDSDEEPEEKDDEEEDEPVEKKGFFGKLKDKFTKKNEEPEDEEKEEVEEDSDDQEEDADDETEDDDKPEEKKGFFQRIKEVVTTKRLSEAKFEELFWDLEVVLLENNVAVEVIEKIKDDLKKNIVDVPIPRSEVEDRIVESLHESISSLFDIPQINILKNAEKKKPYVILFIGINGSGKTTSIAKLAHYILANNKKCVLAAADTFRAAAIQQLEEHGKNLNVKVIKHDYGADPAAVAFDAIKYAESKKLDFVLVDTAGRQHSNANLMDEMKKIVRVSKPDLKLFVGESITGNDCIEQAKEFNATVEIDGLILTKADVDEKGGAAVSVSYVTGKPILFMGMGQEYGDLKPFNKKEIMKNIGLGE